MKELTPTTYVKERLKAVLAEAKKENTSKTTVANSLKFLLSDLEIIDDSFPREIPQKREQEIVNEVIADYQDAVAEEFIKREPELKFKNEWSQEEAFHEFQVFLTSRVARKIASEVIEEVYRPLLERRYARLIKKTPFKAFERLYERNS